MQLWIVAHWLILQTVWWWWWGQLQAPKPCTAVRWDLCSKERWFDAVSQMASGLGIHPHANVSIEQHNSTKQHDWKKNCTIVYSMIVYQHIVYRISILQWALPIGLASIYGIEVLQWVATMQQTKDMESVYNADMIDSRLFQLPTVVLLMLLLMAMLSWLATVLDQQQPTAVTMVLNWWATSRGHARWAGSGQAASHPVLVSLVS